MQLRILQERLRLGRKYRCLRLSLGGSRCCRSGGDKLNILSTAPFAERAAIARSYSGIDHSTGRRRAYEVAQRLPEAIQTGATQTYDQPRLGAKLAHAQGHRLCQTLRHFRDTQIQTMRKSVYKLNTVHLRKNRDGRR